MFLLKQKDAIDWRKQQFLFMMLFTSEAKKNNFHLQKSPHLFWIIQIYLSLKDFLLNLITFTEKPTITSYSNYANLFKILFVLAPTMMKYFDSFLISIYVGFISHSYVRFTVGFPLIITKTFDLSNFTLFFYQKIT